MRYTERSLRYENINGIQPTWKETSNSGHLICCIADSGILAEAQWKICGAQGNMFIQSLN